MSGGGRYQVVIPTEAPLWAQQLQASFNSVFQRIDLDMRSPGPLDEAVYDTVADAEAANLPPLVMAIRTLGYTTLGVGGARYLRVDAVPSHPGYITTSGGTVYWELDKDQIITPLQFGATEATADNSTAFNNAATSAVAIGAELTIPEGTFNLASFVALSGLTVRGVDRLTSIVRRKNNAATSDPVVSIFSQSGVTLCDFTVDGNTANQTLGANNIQAYDFSDVQIEGVKSINSSASSGYGAGIALINGTDAADVTSSSVQNCHVVSNDGTGIYVSYSHNIKVKDNYSGSNGGNGISAANIVFPPVASSQVDIDITGNQCVSNTLNGIGVNGFVTGGSLAVPIYGPIPAIAPYVSVTRNRCTLNGAYGIGYQGAYGHVDGNTCRRNGGVDTTVGGILFNAYASVCSDNILYDNSFYGIDAGGSQYSIVTNNVAQINGQTVAGGGSAISAGASIATSICDNNILLATVGAQYGISAPGVDGDGTSAFPWLGSRTMITGNVINANGNASAIGINLARLTSRCVVRDNDALGFTTGFSTYLIEVTEALSKGNTDDYWYAFGTPIPSIASAATVVIPDVGEEFYITGTTNISNLRSSSQNTYSGKVRDVQITAGGSGYDPLSPPTVSFAGGGGAGAAATAAVSNGGAIIGVNMTNFGAGYAAAPTVSFSSGAATATALVGCDNIDGREITLHFLGVLTVTDGGNLSLVGNLVTTAVATILRLRGAFGNWYEISRAQS